MSKVKEVCLWVDLVCDWSDEDPAPARIGRVWKGDEANPDSPVVEKEGEIRYSVGILLRKSEVGEPVVTFAQPRDPLGEEPTEWDSAFEASFEQGMARKILAASHVLVPDYAFTLAQTPRGVHARCPLGSNQVIINTCGRTLKVTVEEEKNEELEE